MAFEKTVFGNPDSDTNSDVLLNHHVGAKDGPKNVLSNNITDDFRITCNDAVAGYFSGFSCIKRLFIRFLECISTLTLFTVFAPV